MIKYHSIFCQLLSLFSRYEFKKAVQEHSGERHARGISCWDQFIAMLFYRLAKAKSLREIIGGMASQESFLYHLGAKLMKRSSLAYANAHRPWQLYQTIFYQFLSQCRLLQSGHKFRFKNNLLSIDATVIDLCARIFDWAKFRQTKGAVKLHLTLDHNGYLPSYAYITTGKVHEVNVARKLMWSSGTILTFDRAFVDFSWFASLIRQGVWFVTRAKENIAYRVVGIHIPPSHRNIVRDEIIELTGFYSYQNCPYPLRRIEALDPETGEMVVLLTNHLTFGASTISAIYKDRWQIEILFRNLKQHLRIKTFVGTSANALHIQIWTALVVYLLLWYLKVKAKFSWSMSNLFALVRMNLFARKSLWAWLDDPFPKPMDYPVQLPLFDYAT
ncbi:MAG: IS4 family transposase [Pseudomonadota bacterium]